MNQKQAQIFTQTEKLNVYEEQVTVDSLSQITINLLV